MKLSQTLLMGCLSTALALHLPTAQAQTVWVPQPAPSSAPDPTPAPAAPHAQDQPAEPGQEGVNVGKMSQIRKLVPAEQLEAMAAEQYEQLKREAATKQALAPDNHPQVQRLRRIASRLIPLSEQWNPRARQWKWEVNLIGSDQINAFCMPGGKIAFYSGILDKLRLTDDEVAMVMGHEIAHALREHGRERVAKSNALQIGAGIASQIFGLGDLGRAVVGGGLQLSMLNFSRSDEIEADLVGLELGARSGYDPRAAVALWQKMSSTGKAAPPQWLSTHPSGSTRIAEIEKNLRSVLPLYAKSIGRPVNQLPPYRTTPPAQGPAPAPRP